MSWGNCSPLLAGLLAQGDRGEVPGDSDLMQPSSGLSLCLTRCPKFSHPILFLAISKALRMPIRCSLPISRYPGHLRHAGGKSVFMGTPPSASHVPCPVLGTRSTCAAERITGSIRLHPVNRRCLKSRHLNNSTRTHILFRGLVAASGIGRKRRHPFPAFKILQSERGESCLSKSASGSLKGRAILTVLAGCCHHYPCKLSSFPPTRNGLCLPPDGPPPQSASPAGLN